MKCMNISPVIYFNFPSFPTAMVELDGDDIRISSRGKLAERDIVQVTPVAVYFFLSLFELQACYVNFGVLNSCDLSPHVSFFQQSNPLSLRILITNSVTVELSPRVTAPHHNPHYYKAIHYAGPL